MKSSPGSQLEISENTSLIDDKKPKRKKEKIKKVKKEIKLKDDVLLRKKALQYLKQWHKDRCNWKFEKLRQVWLIQNMFDCTKVSDKKFKILLEYLIPVKGSARRLVEEKASQIIEAMEKQIELSNLGTTEDEISNQNKISPFVTESTYERARQILQSLHEN